MSSVPAATVPAATEAASTVDAIKSGVINAAQWLGRQVTVIKDATLAAINKIVAFIKPFIKNLAQYFGEAFAVTKAWVGANPTIAIPAGIAGLCGILAAAYFLFANKGESEEPVNSTVTV